MKCPVLSNSLYHFDCLEKECALGWDKDTNQCVFLAFERIAKALEKIAHHVNVQVAK